MNFLIYLGLFFFDFIAFTSMHNWLIHSVMVYFFVEFLVTKKYDQLSWAYALPIVLLLLEDCFLYGRFGLVLVCLIPLMMIMKDAKYSISKPFWLFFPIIFCCFLLFDTLIVNSWMIGNNVMFLMTIEKFFVNLAVGLVIFMGLRGNRSCL